MLVGFKHSEETKKKISESHMGIRPTEETKRKISISKTGHSNGNKGKPAPWHIGNQYAKGHKPNKGCFKKGHTSISWNLGKKLSSEHAAKARIAALGRKQSLEERLKRSLSQRGEKANNWRGGVTSINQSVRMSFEYKLWRKRVFERDNYTCVWCKSKNGEGRRVVLNADHIKSFAMYPELRFLADNGRTLCIDCHKTTKNYARNI